MSFYLFFDFNVRDAIIIRHFLITKLKFTVY